MRMLSEEKIHFSYFVAKYIEHGAGLTLAWPKSQRVMLRPKENVLDFNSKTI